MFLQNSLFNKCLFAVLLSTCFVACKSPQSSTGSKTGNVYLPPPEDAAVRSLQQKGVDFFATGTSPGSWQLEMNFDDTVRFTADDGLALKFAFNRLKTDRNADRSFYSSAITGGEVAIIITEKSCTMPATNNVYSKQVTFTFNSRAYTGCGKFLADNTLNNKWLLEKIGNTAIRPEEYNRVPVFQFDLTKQALAGNDGCNTLGGNIEVQGNRIKFSNLFSTEMACSKKSIANIINAQVSDKLVSYYFKEGKLFLYLPDDSLLVFRKG
ncbi:MAG: META domain-containing protein [Ferruginibacter sp.]